VLYVDDNRLLTVLVDRIFAADPAVTVNTAPDGRTGLELAFQLQPDIVLLDLHLPGMSGEALLRQLREDSRTRSIPVVIVSGDTEPETIERLTDLGAAGYLTKPFTAAQLRELVSRIAGPGRGFHR
jgi:CheY-like chemotaxis protein